MRYTIAIVFLLTSFKANAQSVFYSTFYNPSIKMISIWSDMDTLIIQDDSIHRADGENQVSILALQDGTSISICNRDGQPVKFTIQGDEAYIRYDTAMLDLDSAKFLNGIFPGITPVNGIRNTHRMLLGDMNSLFIYYGYNLAETQFHNESIIYKVKLTLLTDQGYSLNDFLVYEDSSSRFGVLFKKNVIHYLVSYSVNRKEGVAVYFDKKGNVRKVMYNHYNDERALIQEDLLFRFNVFGKVRYD